MPYPEPWWFLSFKEMQSSVVRWDGRSRDFTSLIRPYHIFIFKEMRTKYE